MSAEKKRRQGEKRKAEELGVGDKHPWNEMRQQKKAFLLVLHSKLPKLKVPSLFDPIDALSRTRQKSFLFSSFHFSVLQGCELSDFSTGFSSVF
jgi:hypothetical protein